MTEPLAPQTLQSLAASILPVAVLVLLGVAVATGLVVWLLGWKLAKPACVVSGVVLGGLGGLMLSGMLRGEGALAVPLVIGAAIAGALLAGLLFRVWMAISAAALLALAVPAAVVIWQGTPTAPSATPTGAATQEAESAPPSAQQSPPDSTTHDPAATQEAETQEPETERTHWQELAEAVHKRIDARDETAADPRDSSPTDSDAAGEPGINDSTQEQFDAALGEAREAAWSWYSQTREQLAAWWNDLDGAAQRMLVVAAGLGAVVGLVLGLVMPYTAAAVQSALAGSLLLLLAGRELVARTAPEWADYFPHSPRGTLIGLGLITLLGVLLQWTFFHKQADKQV